MVHPADLAVALEIVVKTLIRDCLTARGMWFGWQIMILVHEIWNQCLRSLALMVAFGGYLAWFWFQQLVRAELNVIALIQYGWFDFRFIY